MLKRVYQNLLPQYQNQNLEDFIREIKRRTEYSQINLQSHYQDANIQLKQTKTDYETEIKDKT